MQPGRRCAFAQASPSPRTKGVLSGHCPGPCDNPERTAQPRLLVREGAAHAGRPGPGACPIQRALAGNLEKRTPGPRACQCRGPPLEGGNGPIRASRQRTGRPSRRRLGADSGSRRIVRHSPPGGPKLEVQHGPAPSQARWQWMRHSGRCTRTLECTAHCPDGDRPSGPIKRRAPTYTES
jgi:hypothetical protein